MLQAMLWLTTSTNAALGNMEIGMAGSLIFMGLTIGFLGLANLIS